MEHVRTGSLLERYMNDMDKEENDLIETRKRIEASEAECKAQQRCIQAGSADCDEDQSPSEEGQMLKPSKTA